MVWNFGAIKISPKNKIWPKNSILLVYFFRTLDGPVEANTNSVAVNGLFVVVAAVNAGLLNLIQNQIYVAEEAFRHDFGRNFMENQWFWNDFGDDILLENFVR